MKEDILDAAKTGNLVKLKTTLKEAEKWSMTSAILNTQDDEGFSPLHLAVRNDLNKDHEDVIDELLKMRCDVNTSLNEKSTNPGETPLTYASEHGHKRTTEKLFKHNARVGTADIFNYIFKRKK